MSGIVGIWNLDCQSVDQALLARLSRTMAHRGPDGESRWVAGQVGLACQLMRVTPESSSEHQPFVDDCGRAIVFDGRLDNRDELYDELRDKTSLERNAPDTHFVLAAYAWFGRQMPTRLVGDFAFALYDPAQKICLLVRDPIGVRPLYYTQAGREIVFATEIKALLEHPGVEARPNDEFLAGFLVSRSCPNDGPTFFEGISCVPPAWQVVLTSEVAPSRYWDFDLNRRIRYRKFTDYSDAFREHFERAVKRRLRSHGPVAVSVSGGLDSSSIYGIAQHLRAKGANVAQTVGVSYVDKEGTPADEQQYLTPLEKMYGSAIEKVLMGPGGFLNEAVRRGIWHGEAPFVDVQADGNQTFNAAIKSHGARVVLTGHWGDQMLVCRAYLVQLLRRFRWPALWTHLREKGSSDAAGSWEIRKEFARMLIRAHIPDPLMAVVRRVRHIGTDGDGNKDHLYGARLDWNPNYGARQVPWSWLPARQLHARECYEMARSGYYLLCMELNNKTAAAHGLEMAYPFLDRDLVAFLMAIPGEVIARDGVPKMILRSAMRKAVPDEILDRRSKADFTEHINQGVDASLADIRILMDSSLAAERGYLNREVLSRSLSPENLVGRKSAVQSWTIRDLAAVELWFRTFFGPQASHGGAYAVAR